MGELSTEEFRLRLAGLVDPQQKLSDDRRAEIKDSAIAFCAELPRVFGGSLDRLSMWDRIGTGLEAGFAKSGGVDCEMFVNEVLLHIQASPSDVSGNKTLAAVLATLAAWADADRQAWLAYFHTHMLPVLVHAREKWDQAKTATKGKRRETAPATSFALAEGDE